MHPRRRILLRFGLSLILILGVTAELRLYRSFRELCHERDSLNANLEKLRGQLATANSAEDSNRKAVTELRATLRQKSASQSPNHERMLRVLGMLEMEKLKMGPADPLKLNMGFALAGLGVHPELLGNPDYEKDYRAISKFSVETIYQTLLKRFADRNVDVNKLTDLLVERSVSGLEASQLARNNGLQWNSAESAKATSEEQVDSEINQLLGDQNFGDYKAFGKVLGGEFPANRLQQRLSYSAVPMDGNQFEAFAAIAGTDAGNLLLEGRFSDKVVEAAQAVLTPQQLEALRQLTQEQ